MARPGRPRIDAPRYSSGRLKWPDRVNRKPGAVMMAKRAALIDPDAVLRVIKEFRARIDQEAEEAADAADWETALADWGTD